MGQPAAGNSEPRMAAEHRLLVEELPQEHLAEAVKGPARVVDRAVEERAAAIRRDSSPWLQ